MVTHTPVFSVRLMRKQTTIPVFFLLFFLSECKSSPGLILEFWNRAGGRHRGLARSQLPQRPTHGAAAAASASFPFNCRKRSSNG